MTLSIANLARLVPLQGVCYSPAPSDDTPAPPQKYFDTDFTNSCFPLIWGAGPEGSVTGRNDLATISGTGANLLHLYDWSVPPAPGASPGQYERSHTSFLQAADAAGLRVIVPVSNYFLGELASGDTATVKTQMTAMVTEVYDGGTTPMAAAGLWGIANEFDLAGNFSATTVAQAMALLVEIEADLGIPAENVLPICAPVSFAATGGLPPAISAMQDLKAAIDDNGELSSDFWSTRIVGALNSFNDGDFLASYIADTFPTYFPDTPFFFSEMGINLGAVPDEDAQATWVAAQLAKTVPSGQFLGRCVFQFLDQTAMKTGTEATFGMTKFDNTTPPPTGTIPADYVPGGGETYPVDALAQKPLFATVKEAYSG
ncbi:hypothetical protein ACOXXX_00665 [Thalassococcus sp. BH17M4-6]|uniref:hypothetical protein n=1 Tax=Thalassococcus sp. BH17M4-6 TaxID=3413148 RepID=UPI003BC40D31